MIGKNPYVVGSIAIALAALLTLAGWKTGQDNFRRLNSATETEINSATRSSTPVSGQTSPSSPAASADMLAVGQANDYLRARVGDAIFRSEFRYLSVQDGSRVYVVEYEFVPTGPTGAIFPEDVNVYPGTSIIAEIPDCATDAAKCEVDVDNVDAIRIAQGTSRDAPEDWSARFGYDDISDSFKWYLSDEAHSPIFCAYATINVITGNVEGKSTGCPSPPP